MKLKILLVVMVFATVYGNATIRRVGYTASSGKVNGTDYVNFQAAQDAASAGDTIQVYPSTSGATYSGTINKKVIVVGPGYFTNGYYVSGSELYNDSLQNLAGIINSCSFIIDLGSAGTIFQGLNAITVTTVNRSDALNNITISRCRNVAVTFDNGGNCDSWNILQCFGLTITQNSYSGSSNRTITNLLIQNTLINGSITFSTSPIGSYTGNKIYNCVFISGNSLSLSNATFTVQNCIFESQSFAGATNVSFVKNLTSAAATGNILSTNAGSSGNLYGQVMSSIFTGYPSYIIVGGKYNSTPDGRFKLSATSTAKNAGYLPGTTTATDCGLYGGANPYILSGIPAIPVFKKLNSASAIYTGGNYNMNFSINSNN